MLNLGLAYLKAELESEALPIFRRLAALKPGDLQVDELLATCEVAAGNPGNAIRMLEQLRTRDSTNAALPYLLGTAYLKTGQREKAKQAFDDLFRSAPPAVTSLALCKAYYRSGLMDDAERECRSAMQLDGALDGVERELGKVLVSRRDATAADWLRKAVERNPRDAEARYFLGAVLVSNNQPKEATAVLEQARTLNPSFWGNYFYLGKAKLQEGSRSDAVKFLEHAAQLNSTESAIYYQLGRAYTSLGQTERARQAMSRVRELKAQELKSESMPPRLAIAEDK